MEALISGQPEDAKRVTNWSWPLAGMSKYRVCVGVVRLRECPFGELPLHVFSSFFLSLFWSKKQINPLIFVKQNTRGGGVGGGVGVLNKVSLQGGSAPTSNPNPVEPFSDQNDEFPTSFMYFNL